jgi:hypothetical protein
MQPPTAQTTNLALGCTGAPKEIFGKGEGHADTDRQDGPSREALAVRHEAFEGIRCTDGYDHDDHICHGWNA